MDKPQNESIEKRIYKGMVWRFLERGGIQAVSFIVQMIMARILMPEDYGILAIINIFITFATTIINNGLGNALIQKLDVEDNDFSTVFYIQIVLAIIMMIVLFCFAPLIGIYYENAQICGYLRVMIVILLFEALASIQTVILRRNMNFRQLFFANTIGAIGSAVVGISLALTGFGCWSLIWSQIVMKVLVFLYLEVILKWRPRGVFSFSRFKVLFSFSWKLSVAWLVGTLHQQFYSLVIGKIISTQTLGQYNRGQALPSTVTVASNETISTVMFSALSKLQDDKDAFRMYTRRMMQDVSFVICPMMAGIAGISRSFTMFVLTEKWAPSIIMMQLFCISFGINVISTTNMQAFNALGKTEIFMKLELIKRTLSLILLLVVVRISVYAVIISLAFMGVFSLVYNTFPNRRHLKYSILEQISDIIPPIILSIIMFFVVIFLYRLNISYGSLLIIQIMVGFIVYIIMAFVFRIPSCLRFYKLFKQIIETRFLRQN